MSLAVITHEPTAGKADACVIWLHGLGASGDDFTSVVSELGLDKQHRIRFIFPHAPRLAVTINQGMMMPAWYDIYALGPGLPEDEAGLRVSQTEVETLIHAQITDGIPSHRIMLAGFSQGGAVALLVGLQFAKPLAGILALSTYLPLADRLGPEDIHADRTMPILMAHGDHDDVVLPDWARLSRDKLQTLGFTVDWRTYPMAHMLCPQELVVIAELIQRQLL